VTHSLFPAGCINQLYYHTCWDRPATIVAPLNMLASLTIWEPAFILNERAVWWEGS